MRTLANLLTNPFRFPPPEHAFAHKLLIVGTMGILTTAAIITLVYATGNMAFQQHDRGNAAYAQGHFHQALKHHLKAVSINTTDPAYRAALADTHLVLEQYEQAVTQYMTALDLEPGYHPALCGRAAAYRTIGASALANRDWSLLVDPTTTKQPSVPDQCRERHQP